jgi:hypothetical protein
MIWRSTTECAAPGRCTAVPAALRFEGEPMNDSDHDGKVPWMQQLLDNPFLLLFLGVLVPMILYTLWGVIDILTIPLAK